MEKLLKSILHASKSISLEPIFFLLWLNISLVYISINDLYLAKACKVNLNYTETLCDNIHQHPEVQQKTQKYVREDFLLFHKLQYGTYSKGRVPLSPHLSKICEII